MYLCEIPEEEITGLEIPNGLPLIFDVKSKCVKVRIKPSVSIVSHKLSIGLTCSTIPIKLAIGRRQRA